MYETLQFRISYWYCKTCACNRTY